MRSASIQSLSKSFPPPRRTRFADGRITRRGESIDAIAECKRAIAVDPSFGNPYNDIGVYLIAKGELQEAIEWLEKAKLAPRYEPRHFPHMNLGRIYEAKGMITLAIEEFEQALKFQPDEPTCVATLKRLRSMLN